MAESIVQPDTNNTNEDDNLSETVSHVQETHREAKEALSVPAVSVLAPSTSNTIIWTPRFIVLFTMVLVIGLTADSIFTMGWVQHFVFNEWVSFGHVVLVAGCLLGIIFVTRSWWSRLGGIFGCVWATFICIGLLLTFVKLDSASPIPAYLNAATSSALFGTYLCLSLEQTSLSRWDGWFFSIASFVSLCVLPLTFFLMPPASRSLAQVGSGIAATMLVLSILVWWLRPSCWKAQPGTTFLLGLTPAIYLLLNLTTLGKGQSNFSLSLIAYLALLLGMLRVLQAELRRKHTASVSCS